MNILLQRIKSYSIRYFIRKSKEYYDRHVYANLFKNGKYILSLGNIEYFNNYDTWGYMIDTFTEYEPLIFI
jgi:hypothetical protein